MRGSSSRVRVFHETDRGRSLTYRSGRPFSCSRVNGDQFRNARHSGIGAAQVIKEAMLLCVTVFLGRNRSARWAEIMVITAMLFRCRQCSILLIFLIAFCLLI